MNRFVKITWDSDAGDLPKVMQLDNTIDNDDDLKMILQARGKNRVLKITEYTPKPLYLILYVGVIIKKHDCINTLFLHLSPTCSEEYGTSRVMIKNFGKFTESELIFDSIRCTLHDYIVKEDDNTIYFEEFVTNSGGETISILGILLGIHQAYEYQITDKEHKKAMFQRLTEVWEN